jgi:hypothetical protein
LTGQVLWIGCPSEGCKTEISVELLQETTSADLYNKYLKFKRIKLLEKDKNIRWCPKEGCSNYARREKESDLKISCICG